MEIPDATRKERREAEKAQKPGMEKAFCACGYFFNPFHSEHRSDESTDQEENSASTCNPAPWAIIVSMHPQCIISVSDLK